MPTLSSFPALPLSLKRLICYYHTAVSITSFPASLTYIDLSQSDVFQLPSALPALVDTLKLYLSNVNSLPTLSASLRYLDCGSTSITSLPVLPASLKYLSCVMCQLTGPLPALPGGLEFLNVSTNNISSVPNFPATLKIINLGGNHVITSIPALPAVLEFLQVTDNALTSLPALPATLQKLYAEGNLLTSLPALPADLQELHCNYNQILTLPALPASLTYLDCSVNSIYCLPVLPSGNSGVQLIFDNKISCIPNRPAPAYSLKVVANDNSSDFTDYSSAVYPVCNVINNVNGCQAFPAMTGRVYNDYNGNMVKDVNEPYRANVKVALSNGVFTLTNSNGYYEISADNIGAYTLTIAPPDYFTSAPLQYNYNFTIFDTLVNNDFALQATATADAIAISVIPVNACARPGFSYPYLISYTNVGTTTLSPNIVFNYDNARLDYLSTSNPAVLNSASSLTLAETGMVPGEQKSFIAFFTVNQADQIGDSIRAYVSIQANAVSASDSTIVAIKGSFDPNDKSATPVLSPAQVAGGTYIYYTIHFQNTGTDTAFNVVLSDSLNGQLQPATLQVVNTSHPCKATVSGDKIYFEFLNILLPDSNVNEIRSHGYVTFRIKPQPTVALNSIIPNTAQIYFDYNSPVLTNTALTNIAEPLVPVPLKLISFNVKKEAGDNATAHWHTSHEMNAESYNIEMGFDGKNFAAIAYEKAKGYQYNDYSKAITIPGNPTLYFRLKMTDIDGKYGYSPVVILRNDKSQLFSFLNNPVKNELTIAIQDNELKNTTAKIYSAQGLFINSFLLQHDIETADVRSLPAGSCYLITEKSSRQFIIVK